MNLMSNLRTMLTHLTHKRKEFSRVTAPSIPRYGVSATFGVAKGVSED
jgi:hypothetical protein